MASHHTAFIDCVFHATVLDLFFLLGELILGIINYA